MEDGSTSVVIEFSKIIQAFVNILQENNQQELSLQFLMEVSILGPFAFIWWWFFS